MSRALSFLESQLAQVARPYQAAIVAYALSLANSSRKTEANTKLREMAVDVAGQYWGY